MKTTFLENGLQTFVTVLCSGADFPSFCLYDEIWITVTHVDTSMTVILNGYTVGKRGVLLVCNNSQQNPTKLLGKNVLAPGEFGIFYTLTLTLRR